MLHPQLFVLRPGTDELTEAVTGAYAFSATLAIQDITGLATSGVSASHVRTRLVPSAESAAYLFALTEARAPRPVTELGYPELYAEDLDHVAAWVFVSLPLLEDRGVIEANITLDAAIAPLPGEPIPPEPWEAALKLLDALSSHFARPTRHIWVPHAPGEHTPPALQDFGYTAAFREDQATFPIARRTALPDATRYPADTFEVVEGSGFNSARPGIPGEVEQFAHLLTSASKGYPRGELELDTIEWDLKRIVEAGQRLGNRGGHQLTGLAYVDGQIVGLCELVRYSADEKTVCELGLIYVLPEHREKGLAAGMIRATLTRAHQVWEDLETVYCSYPADSAAAGALLAALGAECVSSTTAWHKR